MGACTSTGEQKYKMDGSDMVGKGAASRTPIDGYKLILLGLPRSGKTTLHQQMKCVFGTGFTANEMTIARTRIISYIINIARALVWHADRRRLDTPSLPPTIRRAIARLSGNETTLTADISEHIRTLWHDTAIQGLYHQRAVLYAEVGDTHALAIIPDSASYFLSKVSVISNHDYQPSNEDILRCPLSNINTLINTHTITTEPVSSPLPSHRSTPSSHHAHGHHIVSDPIRNLDLRLAPKTALPKSFGVPRFRVIDAGGATHSRMQWLQWYILALTVDLLFVNSSDDSWLFCCYVNNSVDNVHAVLFVAALSHYDHILPSSTASPSPITASTTTMVEPIVSSVSSSASSSSHKPPASFFTPLSSHRYELTESLNLFEDVCRSPWFSGAHIILILTKSDILKEKCTTVPLRNTCPDYIGNDDYTSYGIVVSTVLILVIDSFMFHSLMIV
jgi:hypothetical protein